MVLPLYLAMTGSEIRHKNHISRPIAWMACQFSPYSQGITNVPECLPPESILILNDRMPCQGHSPSLVAQQIKKAADQLQCESILLDFQQVPNPESEAMTAYLAEHIAHPLYISGTYGKHLTCGIFLPPPPLHEPMSDYLDQWGGRQIWMETGLFQETVTITREGTTYTPQFPPDGLDGGHFDQTLCCRYQAVLSDDEIRFLLYDTADTLPHKWRLAQECGVSRILGLYQELGQMTLS